MSQQSLRNRNAANETCGLGPDAGERLQVELEAPLLRALLRDKRVRADHLRACNPQSAALIRRLLLECLTSPEGRQ